MVVVTATVEASTKLPSTHTTLASAPPLMFVKDEADMTKAGVLVTLTPTPHGLMGCRPAAGSAASGGAAKPARARPETLTRCASVAARKTAAEAGATAETLRSATAGWPQTRTKTGAETLAKATFCSSSVSVATLLKMLTSAAEASVAETADAEHARFCSVTFCR